MQSSRPEILLDLLLAGAFAGFGLCGFLLVNPSGAALFEGPGGISWRTLPFVYSGLLLALTAIFAVQRLVALSRAPLRAERYWHGLDRRVLARRLATLLVLILYVLGFGAFGFTLATPLFLFVMFRIYGLRDPLRNALRALLGGALLWLLFVQALKLPLYGTLWDPITPALFRALHALIGF